MIRIDKEIRCDAILNKYGCGPSPYCLLKATWRGHWNHGYVYYCGRHKKLRESPDVKWERIG